MHFEAGDRQQIPRSEYCNRFQSRLEIFPSDHEASVG